MKLKLIPFTVLATISMTGCINNAPVPLATIPARQVETQKITLGSVQRFVKRGASSADVVEALSSPNIVTSNSDGTETWVYEKTFSERESAFNSNASVSVSSTRNMIVVIKFDKNQVVENVQYRQTSY
jgi:outer membrane protein assembly factor BamE (lipoprotein component of BamABCDE complex)